MNTELREIDDAPWESVNRQYLKRKNGGRRLISIRNGIRN